MGLATSVKMLASVALVMYLATATCAAQMRKVTGRGTYTLSSGDSHDEGARRALEHARMNALDQFGVFLESREWLVSVSGEQAHSQSFRNSVQVIAASVIRLLPGTTKEDFHYPVLKLEADFEIDEKSFRDRIENYLAHQEKRGQIERMGTELEQLIAALQAEDRNRISPEEAQRRYEQLRLLQTEISENFEVRADGVQVLEGLGKQTSYVDAELDSITTGLTHVFSRPENLFRFVITSWEFKYRDEETVTLHFRYERIHDPAMRTILRVCNERLTRLFSSYPEYSSRICFRIHKCIAGWEWLAPIEPTTPDRVHRLNPLDSFIRFRKNYIHLLLQTTDATGSPMEDSRQILRIPVESVSLLHTELKAGEAHLVFSKEIVKDILGMKLISEFSSDFSKSESEMQTRETHRAPVTGKRNMSGIHYTSWNALFRYYMCPRQTGGPVRLSISAGQQYSAFAERTITPMNYADQHAGYPDYVYGYLVQQEVLVPRALNQWNVSLALMEFRDRNTQMCTELGFSFFEKEKMETGLISGKLMFETGLMLRRMITLNYGAGMGYFFGSGKQASGWSRAVCGGASFHFTNRLSLTWEGGFRWFKPLARFGGDAGPYELLPVEEGVSAPPVTHFIRHGWYSSFGLGIHLGSPAPARVAPSTAVHCYR